MEFQSEHEQAEALKRWWDQNGRTVIVGIILLVGAAVGWQSWQERRLSQAAAASAAFEAMANQAATDAAAAVQRGDALIAEYPGSEYAVMAAMKIAAIEVDRGNLDAAAERLRWAGEHAEITGMSELARLRLARIRLAQDDAEAALALVDAVDSQSFKGVASEIRGDALIATGDEEGAREAYRQALEHYQEVPGKRNVVEMKLNSLAAPQEEGAA